MPRIVKMEAKHLMRICMNLEKGLIERIDRQREDVSRSRAVERCLERTYGKSEQPQEKEAQGDP
jgi:metal-responsive CopG/Arc/MetJ family transcriptional regulator